MSATGRLALVLSALAVTGAVAACGGAPPRAAAREYTHTVWRANFDRARSRCDFTRAGWDTYGGSGYPPCPQSVRIVGLRREGLPRLRGHSRAARIGLRPIDSRRGDIFAKLVRPFFAPGLGDGQVGIHDTRPPADVSGSYRAWFYLPRDFRIRGTGWRNIMEFKERYWDGSESGYQSDPTWWLVLYNPRRRHRAHVYAGVRYWGGGNVGSVGRARPFPLGRWVEVRADVRQGRSIVWRLAGRRIATGTPRSYPIGPWRPMSLGWNFIVGNYAGAGTQRTWRNRISQPPLYVGGAIFLR